METSVSKFHLEVRREGSWLKRPLSVPLRQCLAYCLLSTFGSYQMALHFALCVGALIKDTL